MNRPLRIVHVTLGLDVGGQEKLLVEMARHADRDRVALHVVSLTTRGPLAREIEACGWPITAMEAPSGLRLSLVGKLAWLFRKLKADVVHTHDDRPNIHASPAARLARVPLIVHTRHHQGVHLSDRQRRLVRFVSRWNDQFTCISHESALQASQQGIARHRLRVVHNGIDVERFAHRGADLSGYAVVVARLAPLKGIHHLLDAVPAILARCPDFRLHIAGDGPERAALEQHAERLHLRDVVQFLGTVQDVPTLLAGARLFVLPSLSEGISLTLLEAMASGLPVVTTHVGGNPEVVLDGLTGLLVPPADSPALADALTRCWTEPRLCARFADAGRRRVCEQFDVRRMVSDYEAMYFQGRA